MVQMLLDCGADVNQADSDETTALHWAALVFFVDKIIFPLVLFGFAFSKKKRKTYKKAILSNQRGHLGIARTLLRAGADANKKTSTGKTARDVALEQGHEQVVAAIDNHKPRTLLVELCVGLFAMDLPAPILLAIQDAQCQANRVSQGTNQFVSTRSIFTRIVRGFGFFQARALKTASKVMVQVVEDLKGAPMNSLSVTARVLNAKIDRDLDKRTCSVCGKATGDIQMCQGCLDVRFCSAACQKKNWKQHKSVCKMIKAGLLK